MRRALNRLVARIAVQPEGRLDELSAEANDTARLVTRLLQANGRLGPGQFIDVEITKRDG
jgi:hypothetical protein